MDYLDRRKGTDQRGPSPFEQAGDIGYLPRQLSAFDLVQTSRPVYSGSLIVLPLFRSSRRNMASLPISKGRWPTCPSLSPSFSCCICMLRVSAETKTSWPLFSLSV